MRTTLLQGDCAERMRELEEASVDAVVTDPPYGINFMGKAWDGAHIRHEVERRRALSRQADGGDFGNAAQSAGIYDVSARGNRAFQVWTEGWAREAYRVLKPGGYLLAFGGTRTYHRMASGVEDAGFEIRDQLAYMFGTGFPKSLDVSKAIDRVAGAERTPLPYARSAICPYLARGEVCACDSSTSQSGATSHQLPSMPATAEAARWQGWGTALKPAYEPVVVARKPLIGTVAANVLAHGVGAVNVDACRIGTSKDVPASPSQTDSELTYGSYGVGEGRLGSGFDAGVGRWPANVVLGHSPDCVPVGTREVASDGHFPSARPDGVEVGTVGHAGQTGLEERHTRGETVEVWECSRGIDVRYRWIALPDGSTLDVQTATWTLLREALRLLLASSRSEDTPSARVDVPDDAPHASGRGGSPGDCRGVSRSGDAPARPGEEDALASVRRLADALEPFLVPGHLRPRSPSDLSDVHQSSSGERDQTERVSGTPESRTASDPSLTSSSCPASTYRTARTGSESSSDQRGSTAASSSAALCEEPVSDLHNECIPELCRAILGDLLEACLPAYVRVETRNVGACPVRLLDEQAPNAGGGGFPGEKGGIGNGAIYGAPGSGKGLRDTGRIDANGGASRFFYTAKTSRAERNAGLDGFDDSLSVGAESFGLPDPRMNREQQRIATKNHHPTVKPIDLMRWLLRLVVPPGGTILDPFLGSGSTGCAAALEGLDFVGVELDPDYLRIAEARIAFWREHGEDGLRVVADRAAGERVRAERAATGQLDLLSG